MNYEKGLYRYMYNALDEVSKYKITGRLKGKNEVVIEIDQGGEGEWSQTYYL